MYTINNETLHKILQRKFNSLVGILCERIEDTSNYDLKKEDLLKSIKFNLKKDLYNTMREIEEQISSFTDGTTINVTLTKPTSNIEE